MKPGLTFTVELTSKVPVNGLGVPQMARWAYIAFNVSEHKMDARNAMVKEQLDEIESSRLRKEEAELARRVQEARMKILEMRNVMRPQLQDELTIKEVLAADWGRMCEGPAMDELVPSFGEQGRIRRFFEANYSAISDMFKHASAVGSDVGTDTISFMEFSSFLKESNAVHGVHHNDKITHIFMHSHSPDKGTVTMTSELRKHEFFLAMIAVAMYLNIDLAKKGGSSAARARGRRNSVTLTPAEAVQKL
jgi:hypothetical protein